MFLSADPQICSQVHYADVYLVEQSHFSNPSITFQLSEIKSDWSTNSVLTPSIF